MHETTACLLELLATAADRDPVVLAAWLQEVERRNSPALAELLAALPARDRPRLAGWLLPALSELPHHLAAARVLGAAGLQAVELRPQVLDRLADGRASPESAVACLMLLEELGEDSLALTAFFATFLDQHLTLGRAAKALAAARRVLTAVRGGGALPPDPTTRGSEQLRGSLDLGCDPYCLRGVLSRSIAGLGRAARTDRRWMAYLFEALKLWASAEQEEVLAELAKLRPGARAVRESVAELVRYAARLPTKNGFKLIEPLQQRVRTSRRWTWALVDALEADPVAVARWPEVYRSYQIGDPLDSKGPAWPAERDIPRLDALLAHPSPGLVVFAALLRFRLPGGPDAVAAPLAALMADPQGPDRLRGDAARILLAADLALPAVLEAARRAAVEPFAWPRQELREAARALLARHASRPALPEPVQLADGRLGRAFSFSVAAPARLQGATLWCAWQRVLRPVPRADWRTDEDEVGLVHVELVPGLPLRVLPLPVTLPSRPTGASGSRREVFLVGVSANRALLIIRTPFTAKGRWGDQNRLYEYDLLRSRWRVWAGPLDAARPGRVLHPAAPAPEERLPFLSHGELLGWIDQDDRLHLSVDGTRYHLDDWEQTEEVQSALSTKWQAQQELPWLARGELDAQASDWRVRVGDRIVQFPGALPLVRALVPHAAGERFHLLGYALAAPGRLLLVRRFTNQEPALDLLLVWPEGGRRNEEGGTRKEEGGRRNEEGGMKKEE